MRSYAPRRVATEFGRVLRPNGVKQLPHRRKTALQFADRVAVEGRIREDSQLAVDRVGDSASIGMLGEEFGEVPAEIVEHGAHQPVLASEMSMDQSVVDPRARRDVADGGRRESAFGKQVGGRPENGRNNLVLAEWCVGAVNRCLREP